MSRRPRTTQRKNVDPSVMEEARKMIEEGKSKRQVAEHLGMPESTLRKRLKRVTVAQSLGRYKCTFSPEMELEFIEYIRKLDAMFFGLTAKDLRRLAFDFAEKNNIKHQFNMESKMAGKDWLRGFMRRHPTMSLRQPTSTSIARAMGFNKPQVERFYKNLSDLYDKHHFQAHKIYNMDESGFSTVPNKPPKVISTKGKKCVNKISSAERGQNVTVVCAMSASGQYIPPTFIFKRKRMKAELLDNAPPSAIGMTSDSSFINSELFLNWLQHFKEHALPTQEQPVLLILDNHSSHCTLDAVDYCRQNHIILLSLPPHSSHKIQPLDRCFFSPLKKYYAAECENWMRNHPGRTITTFQVAAIFTPAYAKTANIANAMEGFKVTGIWPFNDGLFSEVDFLASNVTDRPLVGDVPETNLTPRTSIDLQAPVLVENLKYPQNKEDRQLLAVEEDILEEARRLCEGDSIANSKTNKPSLELQDAASPSTSSQSQIKLTELSPYPKSSLLRKYCKRSKRSEILSSSPHKRMLEEEVQKKNRKPLLKRNKGPPRKPEKAPKKKVWACPGCSEIYSEPIVEDWIECISCKSWWHERCTDYAGLGHYKCDVCGTSNMLQPQPQGLIVETGNGASVLQLPATTLEQIRHIAADPGASTLRLPPAAPEVPAGARETDHDLCYVCKHCKVAFPSAAPLQAHQARSCYAGREAARGVIRVVQPALECRACPGGRFRTAADFRRHAESEAHARNAAPRAQAEPLTHEMEDVVNQITLLAARAAQDPKAPEFCAPAPRFPPEMPLASAGH